MKIPVPLGGYVTQSGFDLWAAGKDPVLFVITASRVSRKAICDELEAQFQATIIYDDIYFGVAPDEAADVSRELEARVAKARSSGATHVVITGAALCEVTSTWVNKHSYYIFRDGSLATIRLNLESLRWRFFKNRNHNTVWQRRNLREALRRNRLVQRLFKSLHGTSIPEKYVATR